MGNMMQVPEERSIQVLIHNLSSQFVFRLATGLGICLLLFQFIFFKLDTGWQGSLADEVIVRMALGSVVKMIQAGMAFPGTEYFLDRQSFTIDRDPVTLCRDTCDFPFEAVCFKKPFAPVNQ